MEFIPKYIAFCCDNNYVPYLLTAINSVCKNNEKHRIIFCIFSSDLEQENIIKIKNLLANTPPYNKECLFFNIQMEELNGVLLDNLDKRITIATCYRFFVPYYLKGVCKKVLYLDVDLCVCNDIEELFYIDLKDNIIAAVKEVIPYCKRLDIHNYFNAGVLLIDVEKWNEKNLTDRCINELRQIAYPMADQDVLNIILKEHKYILDEKFNYKYNLDSLKNSNYMPPENVVIIHFLSESKPWCLWTQDFDVVKKIYNKYLIIDVKILQPKTTTQIRKTIKNAYIAGKYKNCLYWIIKYLKMKL